METTDGNAAQAIQTADSGAAGQTYATQTTQAPQQADATGQQQATTVGVTQQAAPTMQTQVPTQPQMAPPAQAPAPLYPQYINQLPETQLPTVSPVDTAVNAGIMGMVIVGTGAMGANLHKVQSGDMNLGEAVGNSLAKGAAGAAGAAGATYAASTLTAGGLAGLAVTLGVGTGIGYLLSGK